VVTIKDAVFWGVTPYGSCKNRSFGETYRLHQQGEKNRRVTAPNLLILFTPMMVTMRSSETRVLTKATRPHIPEDGIPFNHLGFLQA
jgi:hypothetical protein